MESNFQFKFEDLQIYTKALAYGEFVNNQIKSFPKEETYRLSSQFIRAADSIALNIAEGYSNTDKQFNRYLQIAWGSIRECVVCNTKARMRNFITEEEDIQNRKVLTELAKMIASYKKYLNSKN